MHTPTSELMKHKLPGGKQSDRDRYTFAPDDSSLWDSLTALREATEELCLHSPRIGVYLAHENSFVFIIYKLKNSSRMMRFLHSLSDFGEQRLRRKYGT